MLKDRFFYPIALAIIAGMVWYALSKGNHETLTTKNILENGYIVNGENLTKLTASPGTSYTYFAKTPDDEAYVTLQSNIPRDDAPPSAGVFAPLGPEFETAFAERNLRITVRARQGHKDPLTYFDMGYFTADVGDSGWKRKPLTPDWENYVIEFKPNTPVNDSGVDYLGVWPGEKGGKRTMDIQSMEIDVVPRLRR